MKKRTFTIEEYYKALEIKNNPNADLIEQEFMIAVLNDKRLLKRINKIKKGVNLINERKGEY